MGNDGGSIPKRIELVKEKQKEVKVNPDLERIAAWFYCALSKVGCLVDLVRKVGDRSHFLHFTVFSLATSAATRCFLRPWKTLQPRRHYRVHFGQISVW